MFSIGITFQTNRNDFLYAASFYNEMILIYVKQNNLEKAVECWKEFDEISD